MSLSGHLAEKFRADIRFRGEAYLKSERVEIIRVTADEVHAIVHDSVDYQTQLSRVEEKLQIFCSCSAGATAPVYCKHLWATLLSVEEGDLITGRVKEGIVPPFTYSTPELDLDDEDWDDDHPLDSLPPQRSSRTATKARKPPQQEYTKLRAWEEQLKSIREEMDPMITGATKGGREREIVYEVDVEKSSETGTLVVQTSQRQRRANGQWGKVKPLKIKNGQLDQIENAEDRQLLAYLSGGMPERSNWYAQQSESQATSFRYRVPYDLCTLILPMMCRTGRVQYLDESIDHAEPLEWDEKAPWELCLTVKPHGDEWLVGTSLVRGEESLAHKDVKLLVPGGLVFHEQSISLLRDFDAFIWVEHLNSSQSLQIPVDDQHDLVEQLLDMPSIPRIELPPELQLEEVQGTPTPRLVLMTPTSLKWQPERLRGEVFFQYEDEIVRGSSGRWAIVQRDRQRCIIRDQEKEEALWAQLQEAGMRRILDQRKAGHDIEISARQLGPAVRELVNHNWEVLADGKQIREGSQPKFRLNTNIDWFELDAEIEFGDARISLPKLLAALNRGETTIRLDDGSLGLVPEEWLQQYGLLAGLGEKDGDTLKFSKNQAAILDALLSDQPVEFDKAFLDMREQFASFSSIEEKSELKTFKGDLRPYQREGLGWLDFLQKFHLGGCLADDMGLGKTVQLLALLQERESERDETLPSLIVVPKSLMFNWRQECERFTPNLSIMEYSGLKREELRQEFATTDIILTTYGTLRRDVMILKDQRFDYIVLDEAQTIKNSSSQIAKASRLLKSNHRVALSGTPIENHLGDLWSIFEFLNPGMLGRSSLFKLHATSSGDTQSRQVLSQGLKPFILRRTKKGVAHELPDKLEQTILCDMGSKQRALYDEMRDHYRQSLLGMVQKQGFSKSKMHVLEALLRLRQVACHPGLLDDEHIDAPSAKLDVLIPDIEELIQENHKALVFSQFTSMLSLVRRQLDEKGITYEYLDGKTRDREKRVERFQNDEECGLFLISLKAGGLGLNLTAADYVFLLDPWWNPAVEAQAIDRAHRVGQTKQVFAYRLICRDTVEEKIAELQIQKRELADSILHAEAGNPLKDMSVDDLELLFS
jgi:superfamily II DNA or RNA helicase